MPYLQAYAKLRLAEALLGQPGYRSSAASALREAQTICPALGAQPLLTEVQGLARRARLDLTPFDAVSAKPSPRSSDAGLTGRERDVIALMAAGKANRQIADELFITEGTAGTHVANILAKLGVRGRTEAAALAHRLGLIDANS